MEVTAASMSALDQDFCDRYIACSLALDQVSEAFNVADIIARAHLDIELDNLDPEFLPYMNVVESLIQVKLKAAVDDLGEKQQEVSFQDPVVTKELMHSVLSDGLRRDPKAFLVARKQRCLFEKQQDQEKQQIIADYDRLTALLGNVADMLNVVRRDLPEVLYADYYGHCEQQMPTLTDLVNVLKATETLILDFFNETVPLSS